MQKYYITKNINEGSFEDYENIEKSTFEMDFDSDIMEKDGVPIISDGHKARGYNLEQPMMVCASTGSGKTRRIIMPYIISCIKSKSSMVINDPKAELYKYSYNSLVENGYRVKVIDIRNLDCGEQYNLLEIPARLYKEGNTKRGDEMFQSLFDTIMSSVRSDKDMFWHTTGASYLTGLSELACDILPLEQISLKTIYDMHIQGNSKFGPIPILRMYYDDNMDKTYYKLISPYLSAPNETKGSLDAVLTSAISRFVRNDSINDFSSRSSFNVEDLADTSCPTALFIISRDESEVYNSFISALVDQIYERVIDIAEEKYNGHLDRRLVFVLDEFGNLAPILSINSKITVSRSRNIGWCLGCQSLDQLSLKYGTDTARVIIGNCNIAYMYSSDTNLLKMISDLCGGTIDETMHISRPLLSIEQLRCFNKELGQTLFLLERKRPFIGFLPDISDYTSVTPVNTAKFNTREKHKIKTIDLKSIIEREVKKRQKQENITLPKEIKPRNNKANMNIYYGPNSEYLMPNFKDWVKNREKAEEEIEDTINEIDKKNIKQTFEELVEERIKKDLLPKPNLKSVYLLKIKSSNDTARVISKHLMITKEQSLLKLKTAMATGYRLIKNVPEETANKLIEDLKKVGTKASIIDYADS